MKVPSFWIRWLYVVVLGVMLFGASMFIAPTAIRQFLSALIYSSPDQIEAAYSADANDYIMLVHGVLGTTLFGWGVAMFLILRGPFSQGRSGGWSLIAWPILLWYLSDTAYSLYTGFWQNAVLNTVLAVLFAVPLVATRKCFRVETN